MFFVIKQANVSFYCCFWFFWFENGNRFCIIEIRIIKWEANKMADVVEFDGKIFQTISIPTNKIILLARNILKNKVIEHILPHWIWQSWAIPQQKRQSVEIPNIKLKMKWPCTNNSNKIRYKKNWNDVIWWKLEFVACLSYCFYNSSILSKFFVFKK